LLGDGGVVSDGAMAKLRETLTLQQHGRFAEADAACRRVLEVEPDNFLAHYFLGLSALRTNRLQRAIELMRKAIAIDPRRAIAHNVLGVALNQLKRHAEALACFERALALDPDFATAQSNRDAAVDDQRQWSLLARHKASFGVLPCLNPPQTFNEHILHRIIHDRDPKLSVICDKLKVRDFIGKRVGAEYAVPLYGTWSRASEIVWADLPEIFVLKPNHCSGPYAIVVRENAALIAALTEEADHWLRQDYFDMSLEWGYRGITARLIAEPLLLGPDGEAPVEPQVFTFAGRAKLIRVLIGRKGEVRHDCWFDPSGRRLAIKREISGQYYPLADSVRRELVAVAERLSVGFSSLRVDFYITRRGLKIGELTPYCGAADIKWEPPSLDRLLGRLWDADVDPSMLPEHR
jgi:tetratricopeptide (TPR) repeat protein